MQNIHGEDNGGIEDTESIHYDDSDDVHCSDDEDVESSSDEECGMSVIYIHYHVHMFMNVWIYVMKGYETLMEVDTTSEWLMAFPLESALLSFE